MLLIFQRFDRLERSEAVERFEHAQSLWSEAIERFEHAQSPWREAGERFELNELGVLRQARPELMLISRTSGKPPEPPPTNGDPGCGDR